MLLGFKSPSRGDGAEPTFITLVRFFFLHLGGIFHLNRVVFLNIEFGFIESAGESSKISRAQGRCFQTNGQMDFALEDIALELHEEFVGASSPVHAKGL